MRRRVPGCAAGVCAAWVAAATVLVRADTVIPWQSAASYVGDIVTVEGDVARARLEADTCVLEFSPGDEKAFRVVLLIPLMTDLPRQPQRLYEGKRVRASGKVTSWQGRAEMIVRGPGAIEVIGAAAIAPGAASAPPSPTTPPTTLPSRRTVTVTPTTAPATTPPSPPTTPASPPSTLPPPVPTTTLPPPRPSAAPSTTTLPPAPSAAPPSPEPATTPEQPEEAPRLPQRVDPCAAARERWRRAATQADARAGELSRCLRAGSYRCRAVASAMAPALSELEWAEQQVEAACP